ncbi:Alpha/Beta hydrolase protein [Talaromyces proteolyticus]|uniref:Dipeptidyl-peptidase V n=1 Tax=Talaromyces proteolyticus TaxID=1131652 RepID=A0AAD4KHI9_9EURO|nr:Alpha/Beta hydrolase protein [Talaromyces proteolyticus]KAH8689559.1 Alpha/Beta hydrolase protein [Talaromyces proteolyticus]
MPELSLEALADLQIPRDLRISPDGQRVIYTLESFSRKEEHPVSSLWVAEIGVSNSSRQITSGVFKDEAPRWSPDGKFVAFISDRARKGRSSAIYLLPITGLGGEAYAITNPDNGKRIASFEWSPDGAYIAFLSEDEAEGGADDSDARVFGLDYQRLRLVDVASRKVTTLIHGNQHVEQFSWSRDSVEIVYTVQSIPGVDTSSSRVEIVNLQSRSARHFIDFRGLISALAWPLQDTIYFIGSATSRNEARPNSVYEARVRKRQWGSYFGWEGDAIALHITRDSVIARVKNTDHDAAHVLGIAAIRWPYESFFKSAFEITGFDAFRLPEADDFTLAITRSSPEQPSEVWSVNNPNIEDNSFTQLSSHNSSSPHTSNLTEAEYISTRSSDGQERGGWLFKPKPSSSNSSTPLPTVVHLHGGSFYQVLRSFSVSQHLEVPLLTAAGYAVLFPNYRGISSHADYADIAAVLRKAIAKGLVDGGRLAISGSFFASPVLSRNEFKFRAALSGPGNSTSAEGVGSIISSSQGTGTLPDVFGTRRSVQTSKIAKTPTLILHGIEDERVSSARAYWRDAQRSNQPVELVLYPRESGQIRERGHLIDLWRRIRGFYDSHLSDQFKS